MKDSGTPELIMKRLQSSSDPTMSTCPIDVLLSRGSISQEAHSAAVYFAGLRKRVFGKATPGAIDLLATSGGRPDELEDNDEAESKYRDACLAIKHYSRTCFDALENLVIHERWPRWMREPNAVTRDRDLALLGLAALLSWHKAYQRKNAA